MSLTKRNSPPALSMRAIAATVASCTKRRFQCRRFGQGSGWIRSIRRSIAPAPRPVVRRHRRRNRRILPILLRFDLRQDLRHAVDIGLAADEADIGKRLRFRDQMLAAAEADLEPDILESPSNMSASRSGADVPISSASCGSRLSIRSAWWMRSLWPLRRPKNEPRACGERRHPAARRDRGIAGARHRSVWNSRCNSFARGSIEEM